MPQLSGFEFIENLSYHPLIVITTAYREHAVKSFELNVFDYLIKPIPFTRFLKTVNKVYQQLHLNRGNVDLSQQEPHIFLKVSKKSIKVNLSDILVIESLKDYIKVITKLGDYVVHKSLTSVSEELPQSNFLRVHRSYTISIKDIKSVEGTIIEIANRQIPVGRNYSKVALGRIFNSENFES